MELRNNIYVCSSTHWDREWRFPFKKTQMMLVEMMDGLLRTLDENPDYRCYHLDSHTVLLEDYCEVRPENEERLRRYVEEGRLMIGPWYVLPDENQLSGESLVRNLLWGERVGRRFGGNMRVGYTPTSFGQVSQMPQIYSGFGVDSIIFYRGINPEQVPGNYYVWEGPDGSRLLGIRLGDYCRCGFFHLVDRPVVYDRDRFTPGHEWAWGGKPFRLCGSGSATPYEFAFPPFGWHPERIEGAFADLEELDLGKWQTPFALAMDSDDSVGPFAMTPKIIAEAQGLVTDGKWIKHGTLPEFLSMAKEALDLGGLLVLRGEMRYPERRGIWTDLYPMIHATRMPTKYMNRRAEFALQRTAEPFSVIAWLLGEEYPRYFVDAAYHFMLQNQAHDSIGGCGRDEVDQDVQHRFRQAMIISRSLTEDAARAIAGRIDTSAFPPEEILLVVVNNLPRRRSEVVRAEIDIDRSRGVKGFQILDLDGGEAPAQVIGVSECQAVFNHPHELPLRINAQRWEVLFRADDLPAMGYKVFRVACAEGEMRHVGTLLTGPASMENEFVRVQVNPNGTVDVTSSETGMTLEGQNLFHDRGEVGDYWVGAYPVRDRQCTSLGARADVAVVEDGPLSAAIEAKLSLRLPARATFDASGRESEERALSITTRYRLVRGERFLRITTTIENTVEDHILKALFPSGIETDVSSAEVPFDVVDRPIRLPDYRDSREAFRPEYPHQNFVSLSDGERGVAVLNRGLPQYAVLDDPQRTIALTLLRAHRAWNSVRLARFPDQPGTQLQGTHTFEYALMPHRGDWQGGGVMGEAERFNVEPVVGLAGPGEGSLPTELSFIEIEGEGLVMNALKMGEWEERVFLRLSNPTAREVKGSVRLHFPVKSARQATMMEESERELPHKGNRIPITVPAKKVVTIRLELAR